jgi:hypothetical protein
MVLKPLSYRFSILIALLFLLSAQSISAQYKRRSSGGTSSWEVGFTAGGSKFLTSINPNSDAIYKKFNYWNTDFNPAMTISVSKNISQKFSAEFEFFTTKLSGKWNVNNGYPVPPMAIAQGLPYPNPFKTGLKQFDLLFTANLNQIIASGSASDKWFLFAKAGVGAAFLKEYSALYPYGPDNTFKYTIIFGGGLSYAISDNIKLKAGTNWYRVETDRLDGVHTLKPGVPLGPDPNYAYNIKERYLYPYLGLTYGFGKSNFTAHFVQKKSNRSSWFKASKKKYKRRR